MRNVEVRLTKVRDAAEPAESFSVRGGDWRALRRALESTVYDGATNLGAFVAEPKSSIQEYLLFTDGLRNFGSGDLPVLRVPVYAISSSTQSDPAWLAQVAHRSGGRYLNLVSDTPADAAKHLLSHATRLVSLDSQGASQVVTASPFPENGSIRLAGVLTQASGRVQLAVGMPGAASRTVTVDIGPGAAESPFAALMWASLRVTELDADYRLHRAEIRRLGKAFGITTRETSLIVLDRIEDYVRFEIVPPAELRAEYERHLRVAQQRRTGDRASQIERVVKLFEQKQASWARAFPMGVRPTLDRPGPKEMRARPARHAEARRPASCRQIRARLEFGHRRTGAVEARLQRSSARRAAGSGAPKSASSCAAGRPTHPTLHDSLKPSRASSIAFISMSVRTTSTARRSSSMRPTSFSRKGRSISACAC